MPCTHGIPVGMMWTQTLPEEPDTPSGNPLYRQFRKDDLDVIKNPAAAWSSYIACDREIFEDSTQSTEVNDIINRWKAIIEADRAAGLKCSIGYLQKLFYVPATNTIKTDQINDFVDAICNISNVGDVVESWHVIDKPAGQEDEGDLNKTAVRDLVKAVNDRQQLAANGSRNWPFHIVLNADAEGTQVTDFWPPYTQGSLQDRKYDPDPRFKDYVDAIAACWPTGAGAKVIISLFYYPWASDNWHYSVLPPWRKWKYIIEKFRSWYPSSTTHPIHFVLEGGASNTSYSTHLPGHVDMHQQVRMAPSSVWKCWSIYEIVRAW